MPAGRLLSLVLLAVVQGCGSCGPDSSERAGQRGAEGEEPSQGGPEPEGPTEAANRSPLLVSPESYDFSDNPPLLERILANPHGYFRFVNVPFSQQVCERFGDVLDAMPAVNLHGDAHLEQYAVTDDGRGLSDFDDSSTGPNVIDLIRFGVSLRLTCRAHGWSDACDGLFRTFLDDYRAALEDPDKDAPKPPIVDRIRRDFPPDRSDFLDETDGLMETEGLALQELMEPFQRYAETMRAQDPDLAPDFFEIKRGGRLHVGVGSALDEKYLVRVEGPTDADGDDVVLEIKEVRNLNGIQCLDASRRRDPFRILVGQSRIAYRPYRFVGYVRWNDKTFWIHAWEDNYAELDVRDSLESVESLRGVVEDVAVQLGRGHPLGIADPLDLQLRRALIQIVRNHGDRIEVATRELTEETVRAWKLFREAADGMPGPNDG